MSHQEALSAYHSKDYERAISLWQEETQKQNDQAMVNLGLMYLKAEGVKKDVMKAKEWFEKASLTENDSAYYNLGLMYQSGIGVAKDLPKAIEYFEKACEKNHKGANFRLALLLLNDRSNEALVKKGFTCMLDAALAGHPMAKMQITGMDKAPLTCKHNIDFRTADKEKQLAILRDALDRYIRPILIKDGGDILLIDFINSPYIEIRLAYQGNCAGCSMASTSTYALIHDTLSKVIDTDIRVFVL